MPRDIPVGNGRLLVTFDHQYQLRDLYFPHVGQENHAGNGPCRFGIHTDLPGKYRSELFWSNNPSWQIRQRYLNETLTTSVSLEHRDLQLVLYCNDVVDFHRDILVRKIKIKNMAGHERVVRVMHHQDFNMLGTKVGDTAYYDPELRSIVHYRAKRYLMLTFYGDHAAPGAPAPGLRGANGGNGNQSHNGATDGRLNPPSSHQGIDEYATGTSGFHGAEGTWRDAEDGHLQGNPIAQGAVDSTISSHVRVEPEGEKSIYMVIIAGHSREELIELHRWLVNIGPQAVIDRTTAYWRLWVGGTNINFGNLPGRVVELFKRSLLVLRTQIDNGGAIIAANDSDIMQFSRDTYSYMWPRDGALVANALDLAGFPDLARWFYQFCAKVITAEGYFLHKYNPDGSPASSWHPWVLKGQQSMPIQEDETALVVWALWRHYYRYRDIEFIRPLWVDIVQKAADFMARYRDSRTGLPLPSYDLWEERWGVHAFTVATVYGGLKAAHNFAVAFGDRHRAENYKKAAEEVKAGAAKYLFSEKLNRFVRRLVNRDVPKPPDSPYYQESSPLTLERRESGDHGHKSRVHAATPNGTSDTTEQLFEIDETIDASLYAIYKFHLFEADDPRVASTMQAVEQKLWVRTEVGGVARYENDYYHRISDDIAAVPGNPWFICTLWLADYYIARATSLEELKKALPIFEWTAAHALESGVLAEQVNPYTNDPISVSPLTWSHATVVSTVIKYLEKLEELQTCPSCKHPMYRLRSRGTVEVKSQGSFSRLDAEVEPEQDMALLTSAAELVRPRGSGSVRVKLSIDPGSCIGCDVCVAHCHKGVLKMPDNKAMIDLQSLQNCDADGRCVEVCPTQAVKLSVSPAHADDMPVGAEASVAVAPGAGGMQIPVDCPLPGGAGSKAPSQPILPR
jgi:GH15 family glucan-1,4-alpha-glucosidase/ferredoxin